MKTAEFRVAKKLSVTGTTEPRYFRTSSGCSRTASEMEQKIDIARIEGQVKASSVKKVADFVQAHPDEAAGILRSWVAEG